MKSVVCLLLVALAADAMAQSPSPLPIPESSPLPTDVMASPLPTDVMASPMPTGMAMASPEPLPEPEPVDAPAGSNITDQRIAAYFSSPLFAIQQVPELEELAQLAAGSNAAALLSNKTLVSTIFAPNNQAVNSAVDYIETATGVDISTLTEMGVVEQLLAYHVAPGAALAMDRLVGGQELTMLDGNMTTISTGMVGGARRLLQLSNETFFISTDSNQKVGIQSGNIQGGRSILHVIDGVLVPRALLEQYNISTAGLPGFSADLANSTLANSTAAVLPATPAKSAAGATAAALLSIPALLALLLV